MTCSNGDQTLMNSQMNSQFYLEEGYNCHSDLRKLNLKTYIFCPWGMRPIIVLFNFISTHLSHC